MPAAFGSSSLYAVPHWLFVLILAAAAWVAVSVVVGLLVGPVLRHALSPITGEDEFEFLTLLPRPQGAPRSMPNMNGAHSFAERSHALSRRVRA